MAFIGCIYISYQNEIMFCFQIIKSSSKLITILLTTIVMFKNKLIPYWFCKHTTGQCDHTCIGGLPISTLDGKLKLTNDVGFYMQDKV